MTFHSQFIFSLQDAQPIIRYALQHHTVIAYFVSPTCWSGLMPITIKQAENRNFQLPALITLFENIASLESAIIKVVQKGCCIQFLCVFDHNLHNNGTDACPYLVFHFRHFYMVENFSKDDLLSITEVIQM